MSLQKIYLKLVTSDISKLFKLTVFNREQPAKAQLKSVIFMLSPEFSIIIESKHTPPIKPLSDNTFFISSYFYFIHAGFNFKIINITWRITCI